MDGSDILKSESMYAIIILIIIGLICLLEYIRFLQSSHNNL